MLDKKIMKNSILLIDLYLQKILPIMKTNVISYMNVEMEEFINASN